MKTMEQIKERKFEAIDGRDLSRMLQFVPLERWKELVPSLKDSPKQLRKKYPKFKAKPFTRVQVLKQLKADVAFGFEKALDQRGISASLMHEVVSMWNWVLEEGLEKFDDYAQYGLPLFKATAVKYGFPNPIGKDKGNERKYASD